jgi:hypothetical protein
MNITTNKFREVLRSLMLQSGVRDKVADALLASPQWTMPEAGRQVAVMVFRANLVESEETDLLRRYLVQLQEEYSVAWED